jgi:septal ring factor EnvC (AmiA/AmiB activator)
LSGAVAGLQQDVTASDRRISSFESDKKKLEVRLRARLRAMYKMGRGEAMEVLLSSDSSTLGRRHKYLTMIMDMDAGLIQGYEKTIAGLDAERRKKASILNEADSARRAAAMKKTEAEALHKTKLTLLSDIKLEKVRREGAVAELEKAASELTKLIDRLRSASVEQPDAPKGTGFASMKGRLAMPANGQITSRYGKVKHPRFQTVTFNNGIIIDSPWALPSGAFTTAGVYVAQGLRAGADNRPQGRLLYALRPSWKGLEGQRRRHSLRRGARPCWRQRP